MARKVRARTLTACVLGLALGCDEPEPPAPITTPVTPKAQDMQRPSAPQETRLAESMQELRQTVATKYVAPTSAESDRFRAWVGHLSTSIIEATLPREPPPDGFTGRLLDAGRIWLLSEPSGHNRGAGAVALRVGAESSVVVEVPHSFFDEGTLPIGLAVFKELQALALLVNTVHRGGIGPEEERAERARSGKSESDVAHQTQSFFHQAHLELGRVWPRAQVIQLHGYRDEKVPTAKIVVSAAGTAAAIAPLAKALNDAFGPATARLYPEEVDQLGGTQNVQAEASRDEGRDFVHLEMAASFRNQLVRQKSLRDAFARALAKGLSVR
jgi:hypothetical protein